MYLKIGIHVTEIYLNIGIIYLKIGICVIEIYLNIGRNCYLTIRRRVVHWFTLWYHGRNRQYCVVIPIFLLCIVIVFLNVQYRIFHSLISFIQILHTISTADLQLRYAKVQFSVRYQIKQDIKLNLNIL